MRADIETTDRTGETTGKLHLDREIWGLDNRAMVAVRAGDITTYVGWADLAKAVVHLMSAVDPEPGVSGEIRALLPTVERSAS